MKSLRFGAAAVAASTLAVLMWMTTPVTSAEAALIQYWYGNSTQNQIHSSATRTMIGGEAYLIAGGSIPIVRLTVAGHGSSEGPGAAVIGGFSLTTWQYCQWRWTYPDPASYGLKCSYKIS